MPKPIVLGNGNLTLCLDNRAQVSDLYFPHVGLENHIDSSNLNQIGVWVENQFSWFSNAEWNFDVEYKNEEMVSNIVAVNDRLKIKIIFHDLVYNERDIFVRHLKVENNADREREIRVFFDHQFQIYQSPHSDTGYYDPREDAIIHYLGKRAILANLKHKNGSIDDYTTGIFGIEGKEGTYKDAENGNLSQNPIEHGSVSETISSHLSIEANQSEELYYWLATGECIDDVRELNNYTQEKGPSHLQNSTANFWHAWVNKQKFTFHGLDQDLVDLFNTSQLIVRAHMDNNGAIIASLDSDMLWHGRDTYSYMWPRDGAYIVLALEKLRDQNISKRFFEFCKDLPQDEGYFMHKYRPDGTVGSSWHPWIHGGEEVIPIQEDETALVLVVLWEHYTETRDIEFIEDIYNSFIEPAAEFMYQHRDKSTGLPKPSYDLWEEKFGISTYTASTVYGGLKAGSKFADLLGKQAKANKYQQAADQLKKSIMEYLYDSEEGYFYKLINNPSGNTEIDKTVDISSVYGVFLFNVLDLSDDKLQEAFEYTVETLSVDTEIGGIMRYEGDSYYKDEGSDYGNPWVLATLWKSQFDTATAQQKDDLDKVVDTLKWVERHAFHSGILPEQIDPHTGKAKSATPLAWSHAEYIRTVVMYLEKLESFGVSKVCYPVDN